jgi:hypothetical protein
MKPRESPENGQSTFTGSNPSVRRSAIDYARIRCYVRLFDLDVLAVQKVDSEEVLSRVVHTGGYNVHVSGRSRPGYMNGKQNTGFAYEKGLSGVEQSDVTALDVSGGTLRHGTRIDVAGDGQTVKLMSVHLKSRCFSNSDSGSACTKLFLQVLELEGWIDAAANDPEPFIILGDFNRRFNEAGGLIWTNLDDGVRRMRIRRRSRNDADQLSGQRVHRVHRPYRLRQARCRVGGSSFVPTRHLPAGRQTLVGHDF